MSLSLPPYLEQWSKASENPLYSGFIGMQGQTDSLGSNQVLGIMVDVAGLVKEPEKSGSRRRWPLHLINVGVSVMCCSNMWLYLASNIGLCKFHAPKIWKNEEFWNVDLSIHFQHLSFQWHFNLRLNSYLSELNWNCNQTQLQLN